MLQTLALYRVGLDARRGAAAVCGETVQSGVLTSVFRTSSLLSKKSEGTGLQPRLSLRIVILPAFLKRSVSFSFERGGHRNGKLNIPTTRLLTG